MANVGVLGAGSWGTALSVLLHDNGHEVTIWSIDQKEVEMLNTKREHESKLPGVKLAKEIVITNELNHAIHGKDFLVLAVPSIFTRATARKMSPFVAEGQMIVDVAKGIEEATLMTLSEQIHQEIPQADVAVLSGPSHAEEVGRKLPTTCVIGAKTKKTAEYLQSMFNSRVFRVYTSPDILGIELGGALKNVIALAAGIADGLGYGDNTKAALITRGIAEIARLGMKMGGKLETFTGLTGIGDLIVTCASVHSRNRKAGYLMGQGKSMQEAMDEVNMVVEGVYSAKAAASLAKKYEVPMPIVEEINRRFVIEIQNKYPGDQEKIRKMAILYDGQVRMAHLAIAGSYSVNGVARLHTDILKKRELKDFYEMMPEKFNNKTNGITQRRFLLHGNPLLASWVTDKIGDDWITNLDHLKHLKVYVDDEKCQQEFMNIKYQNKVRLAKYIKEHNGIDVDPRSIFDCQVKRLHEYKRQLMNILHVMYLYNEIKAHPDMDIVPRTFIFGAKAAAGYYTAKLTIKLINAVADKINNDPSINGKIKVVFIEDYRVSNAELIFAAADVSEQISTASKEASGTGNMKFMLNGALTLGTMDGANVEIVEEVGKENAFIFGLSADQVMEYEKNGNYNPRDVYNNNQDVRQVLTQLVNGFYSPENPELFRALYDALLEKDTYFTLLDFDSYKEAHNKIDAAYRDEEHWARTAMLQTASAGKFSSDRTIEEYAKEMWHLEKVTL